jgi:hypothetical protein
MPSFACTGAAYVAAGGAEGEDMMRNKLPAIHPGEFLAEILGEIGV